MGVICEIVHKKLGFPGIPVSEGAEQKLLVLTWDEFVNDVLQLARKLDEARFDALAAVARGGLVVARLLSDMLGVRKIASLAIEYYERVGKRLASPRLVGGLNFDIGGMRVLVVDDVADTGETLKLAVEYVKKAGAREAASCTVYIKPWCKFKPDYYAKVVEGWVVFPYEQFETALHLLSEGWSFEELAARGLSKAVLEHLKERGGRPSF